MKILTLDAEPAALPQGAAELISFAAQDACCPDGLFGVFAQRSVEMLDDQADARVLFEHGRERARAYRCEKGYVVLDAAGVAMDAALAAICAINRKEAGLQTFASETERRQAQERIDAFAPNSALFEKLGRANAAELLYVAGFMLDASRRFPVVIYGSAAASAALLIADKIAARDGIPHDPRNITLCLPCPDGEKEREGLKTLLSQLDFAARIRCVAEETS